MGIYLNPGNDLFYSTVTYSEIYVDKTMLISFTNKCLFGENKEICVSRPRRFGKSMAENMLTAYYSKGCDSRELFSKFQIAQTPDFEKHLNRYNVIHIDMQKFLGRTKFEQNHYITHANTYQNGVIYTGSEGSSTAAYFLDYESMQAVPLCNKPNCAHKDTSCLAFQCVQDSIMPFVYQGMVYWFHTDSKITDSDDGRSTAYQFQTTCYCGNMTTGEVESFVEIPDVSMKDAIEFVISNHTLYIIGCDCAYQEEDGSWTEMSRIGDQYLYAINLDTADVKNYGLINDAPTASYNWTLNGAMFADVELTGIYQNKLYLSYRYVDDPNDIIDYVNTGDPDSPDWSDAGTAIPWHRVNKCLNLETDTIEPSEYPAADLIQDDTYIYYMDGQYHVMDADGTETVSADIPANNSRNLTFVNGIFWDGPQSTCFQPKTGETHVLSETYSDTNLTVIAYYKERYIINYTDENNLIHFEAVPESDLIGGIVE